MKSHLAFPAHRPGIWIGAWLALAAAALPPVGFAEIPPVQFRTPPAFVVGNSPWHVTAADVNHDGRTDLITANAGEGTVSVLLGNGAGSFTPAVPYGAGSVPDAVAVGDLNGDGHPDLVTANATGWSQPGSVSVLLGTGAGTFGAATSFSVGQGPVGVVVADFNGDGSLDVATAISGGWRETNQVHVLFGRGDGTLDPPASYSVGVAPAWIAAGDFNGDHHPDLVVPNSGPGPNGTTASVLLNNGDGTFAGAANYTVGGYPRFVAVGDFNRDGAPDVAVANVSSSSVSLLLGRGDGAFSNATHWAVPAGAARMAVGDFNDDGRLDLAVQGGDYDSGTVSVLLGSGTGSFGAPTPYSIGTDLLSICAGEFNLDPRLDLAVTAGYDNTVLVMTNSGNGTFKDATDTYPVGGGIQGIITGDFDTNSLPDIATVNLDTDSVTVILQQTNGHFLVASNYIVGDQPHAVKAGDFNNDGRPDLVTANFDGTLTLLRGRSSRPGAFAKDWPTLTLGSNHTDVAVGYFNSGTHLDVVTPNYYGASLSFALGVGDGTFHIPPPPAVSVNSGPTCVVVEDFNGDGQADLAVGYDGGSVVSLLLGRGDGTFNPKTDCATWEIPWHLAVGDFNYDGKPDLVAANYDWRRISVLMNNGDGTFAPPVTHPVANDPVSVAVGDFNGDNLSDIVSGNYASLSVLLGFGNGTFSTATNYFLGGKHAAVGDFNRDGMPDLAIDLGGKVGIFWNETIPRLQIDPVSTGVRIAWPAWKGYELEAAASLAAGSSWSPVNTAPAVIGSQNVITNPVNSGNQVFRLKRR